MKSLTLLLIVLLLSACSATPEMPVPIITFTPTPTSTPEPIITFTPTSTSTPEMCFYIFDRPSGEQVAQGVKEFLESAGIPEVTVWSGSHGESCVYASGTRVYNPAENDLEITIEDVDLENKDLLDEYTFRILTRFKPYDPQVEVGGQITLIFNASDPQIVVEVLYADIHAILEQHPTGEGLLDALRAN
jgi:hypothetical protein